MGRTSRGDGVVAVAAPWVAAGKAAEGERRAAHRAMGGDRFESVRRARRHEAAGRDPVLVHELVPAEQARQASGDQAGTGCGLRCGRWHQWTSAAGDRSAPAALAARQNWASTTEKGALATSASAPTRYQPGTRAPAWRRATARSRRRTRLRIGALPTERPTEKAIRGGTAAGSAITDIHRGPTRARRPSRRNRPNTARFRMRQITPRGGPDPWHGGT